MKVRTMWVGCRQRAGNSTRARTQQEAQWSFTSSMDGNTFILCFFGTFSIYFWMFQISCPLTNDANQQVAVTLSKTLMYQAALFCSWKNNPFNLGNWRGCRKFVLRRKMTMCQIWQGVKLNILILRTWDRITSSKMQKSSSSLYGWKRVFNIFLLPSNGCPDFWNELKRTWMDQTRLFLTARLWKLLGQVES